MTTNRCVGILLSIVLSSAISACGGEPPSEPTSSGVTRSPDVANEGGTNAAADESDGGAPPPAPSYGGGGSGGGYCGPACRGKVGASVR